MDDDAIHAAERLARHQAHAAALGIDEALISTLVDAFYERVRGHAMLGPIFEDAIGDDWDAHLARMKRFWASVALHAGTYSGKPVPAHKKLAGVRPWHFDVWLALFRQTLIDVAPNPTAANYFLERAHRIAQSLQVAMFGMDDAAHA